MLSSSIRSKNNTIFQRHARRVWQRTVGDGGGRNTVGTGPADARRHAQRQTQVSVAAGQAVAGDAANGADVRTVCVEATHAYNCTTPPDYHR
jgi:hypothetical protein